MHLRDNGLSVAIARCYEINSTNFRRYYRMMPNTHRREEYYGNRVNPSGPGIGAAYMNPGVAVGATK
jgi:hypothetical protein